MQSTNKGDKQMKVKFISANTKEARLANRRVLLVRDETCRQACLATDHDGDVFGLLVEEWNDEERQFKMVDSSWGLYSFDDVKSNIADIVGKYDIDCFVVDNDLGDPEKWKEEFRGFDI